jgi:hypothetical protein
MSKFPLGLESFRQDDGGAGCGAPAQGLEEVSGRDQAALVDLVLRFGYWLLTPDVHNCRTYFPTIDITARPQAAEETT